MIARTCRFVVAAAVAVVGAGCSSRKAAPFPGPTQTPPSNRATTARDAVIAAYTEYWPVSVRAAKLPQEQARPLLVPYLTPDAVTQELAGAAEWRAKHFQPWGFVTVHVTSVHVTGRTATLNECQNATTAGIADTRTGRLIPGTTGGNRVPIKAMLVMGGDGRWRLQTKEMLDTPCTPPTP